MPKGWFSELDHPFTVIASLIGADIDEQTDDIIFGGVRLSPLALFLLHQHLARFRMLTIRTGEAGILGARSDEVSTARGLCDMSAILSLVVGNSS